MGYQLETTALISKENYNKHISYKVYYVNCSKAKDYF